MTYLWKLMNKKQYELLIEYSYNNLINQIKTWEQTYLVIAPIKETVSFNQYGAKIRMWSLMIKYLRLCPMCQCECWVRSYYPYKVLVSRFCIIFEIMTNFLPEIKNYLTDEVSNCEKKQ